MKSVKRRQRHYRFGPLANIKKLEPLKEECCSFDRVPCRSVSCPCILPSQARETLTALPWTRSAIFSSTLQHCNYKTVLHNHFARTQIRAMANLSANTASENYSSVKKLGAICACPGPCSPSCGCSLPPPCNTPAKCLQYMHGYYYYPYGTWFCGPYHVSTGACGPCSGPVRPGGPCCPATPCPGGPCGPLGVSPGGPCGPSSPCACGPLGCCGVCGMGPYQNCGSSYPGPYGFNPYGSNSFANVCNYNGPFGPFSPHNQYNQYQTYNPWECYNQSGPCVPFNNGVQFAGPLYNVPCQIPVQVNNTEAAASGGVEPPRPSSPTRKCCVVWPLPKTESVNEAALPIYPPSQPLPSSKAPCPKNLHPKSLPLSAPSRFDINPSMNRNQPIQKPRYNARAMDQILTQACVLPTNMYSIRKPDDIKFKSILNAASKYFINAEKNRIHEKKKRS